MRRVTGAIGDREKLPSLDDGRFRGPTRNDGVAVLENKVMGTPVRWEHRYPTG